MPSTTEHQPDQIDLDWVSRARAADALVWELPEAGTEYLRERDAAVHAALREGVGVEQVSSALGVRSSDVERMARDHEARTVPAR